jgi:hypothetical protein
LNKNIKKYLRFSVRAKHWKMLSTENGFLKNDFPETILRRKPFYVETNRALLEEFGHSLAFWAKLCSLLLNEERVISGILKPSDLLTND